MLALREFADFVTMNMANLVSTYTQLLVDSDVTYSDISHDSRAALGRRYLNAVAEAYHSQTSDPLFQVFNDQQNRVDFNPSPHQISQTKLILELECLGQTLTPVVTNLEAGKFLWQILSETRLELLQTTENISETFSKNKKVQGNDHKQQIDKALKEARQENERLSTAISNAAVGVVITDPHQPDNPITYVNPAFTKITGYSAAEAIGQNCRFLQGPDTDKLAVDVIRQAIKQEKRGSVVLLNYHLDGSTFWNELTINPVFDENEQLINYIGIQMDVTARQQAENVLLRRASDLEAVAQVSIAISTISNVDQLLQEVVDLTKSRFDLYHAHIYVLDELESDLNLTAGASDVGRTMVKQGWRIPIAREDSIVAQAARSRRAVIVDDVRKEPSFLPNPLLPDTHSEMAVPMIIGDKLLGVLDVQSDQIGRFTDEDAKIKTTLASQTAVALQNAIQYQETQKALLKIKNSQDLLRTVIDATPDWIFIKDKEHCYRLANKSYSDSIGIPVDEFIGKNDLELGFPEDIVKGNPERGIIGFWPDDDEILATGQTKFIDVEPAEIDGEQLYLNIFKVPVRDAEGNVWGVLGYIRDITEREQLWSETRQLYETSMALNKASSYLDVIQIIRKYTIAVDADYISLGHFGQAVSIGESIPDKVYILARWSEVSESLVRSEYDFNEFPGLKKYIQPEPVVIKNFSQETIDAKTKAVYDSLNAKTLIYVPIAVAEQWNGFIAIIYQHQRSFSDNNIQNILAIASQVSVAVENIRLFDETQRRASRETIIREVTDRMQKATSLKDLVKITAEELGDRFSAEYSLIELGSDVATQELNNGRNTSHDINPSDIS